MYKNKIKRLADYAVRQCCGNSDNCYWSVSYDELRHRFGAEITDSNENGKLLKKELRQRERGNQRTHHDRGLHRNDLPPQVLPTVPGRTAESALRPRL